MLGHLLGFFLTHGTAKQVSPAKGIARHVLGDLHDLFLIDDNPVGRLQDGFQDRMRELGFLFAMLDVDVVVDHAGLERARPEEGDQRDDVFKTVGTEPLDQILHAAGFQLENSGGLATL